MPRYSRGQCFISYPIVLRQRAQSEQAFPRWAFPLQAFLPEEYLLFEDLFPPGRHPEELHLLVFPPTAMCRSCLSPFYVVLPPFLRCVAHGSLLSIFFLGHLKRCSDFFYRIYSIVSLREMISWRVKFSREPAFFFVLFPRMFIMWENALPAVSRAVSMHILLSFSFYYKKNTNIPYPVNHISRCKSNLFHGLL
jgi:hypothetical protein